MDKTNPNTCIECSVTQCANHATDVKYCALNKIKLGTHEKNPTVSRCVDCESFVLDPKNSCCK